MVSKKSENGPKMKPKSIKRWREGEERRGRGEERREEEKETKARREKEQKGGQWSEGGVAGLNCGDQGEVYPPLKGGTPPGPWLGPGRKHSGLLGTTFFRRHFSDRFLT